MGVKTGDREVFENKLLNKILLSVTAEVIMELRQNAKLLHLTWTTKFIRRLTIRMSVPTHTSIQADGSLLIKKKLDSCLQSGCYWSFFRFIFTTRSPHSCMTEQPHVKHLQL
jgi:hypothetical protein